MTNAASPSQTDPHRLPMLGVTLLFMVTLPIIIGIVVMFGSPAPSSAQAFADGTARQTFAGHPPHPGKAVYDQTCMACHGTNGDGVPGLGKPLRNSAFVQESSDEQLFANIADGRSIDDPLNTTGIMMPPRGAQNISDDQINDVVAYLRTLQDPSQAHASLDAWIIEKASPPAELTGLVGRDAYISSCSACHGANGEGIEGLGKAFIASEFINSSSDKEITTLVKMGRPVWDPANTTGIDMPPKGGNPALSDEDLINIIAFIRAISEN